MATNDKNRKITSASVLDGVFNHRLLIYTNFPITEQNADDRVAYQMPPWTPEQAEQFVGHWAAGLCQKILGIPGISGLTISTFQLTVYKYVPEDWMDLKPQVELAVQELFSDVTVVLPQE